MNPDRLDGRVAADYSMVITTRGVRTTHRSFEDWIRHLKSEWSKVRYIVSSEVRIKVYDKTMGLFFLLLEPILMAAVYYILSMVMLGARSTAADFTAIYVAVVFWRWFSRTIDASPGLFNTYSNVLKQTNFPVYSILFSHIGLELVTLGLAFLVLFCFLLGFDFYPNVNYAYIPVVMATQMSVMVFLSLVFSVAGAFLKDLQGVLYAFTSLWFYLSPGIYPVSRIPERWLWLYNLNPFAHILPAYQAIFLRNGEVNVVPLAVIFLTFSLLSVLGFRLLATARYYFFNYL